VLTATEFWERSMKVGILEAAVFLCLVATPAMAQQQDIAAPMQPSVSTYCATIQPGNPYSPVYDFQAYNAFRSSGAGWDSRGDDACARNPLYSPQGTSPLKPNPYPNPSWF
jgi:hypothetical protein